jgi:hypothetical protein
VSPRCNWTNSMRCSVRSRRVRSVRLRPSNACHGPRTGCGPPSTP